jgi:hypothetical protein
MVMSSLAEHTDKVKRRIIYAQRQVATRKESENPKTRVRSEVGNHKKMRLPPELNSDLTVKSPVV